MVRTGKGGLVYLPFVARDKPHALMATNIIKCLYLPYGISQDNERMRADLPAEVVPGARNVQSAANT